MASALSSVLPDDTRARLIEAAGEVFAEQGYRAATVREICAKAGANVAAVNYHFRDKMGLYVEVVRESLTAQGSLDPMRLNLDDMEPDDALRALITNMVRRIVGSSETLPHLRIMSHELAQPTEALPRVAEQAIGPAYLLVRRAAARLLKVDAGHDAARLCAHSIIGQVVHFGVGKPVIGLLWPAMKMSPRQLEQIAEHITEFTLAGIRATAQRIAKEISGKRK